MREWGEMVKILFFRESVLDSKKWCFEGIFNFLLLRLSVSYENFAQNVVSYSIFRFLRKMASHPSSPTGED